MPDQPPILRTLRLDLVATTLAHLDAELGVGDARAPHPLHALLDARVPAGWPPGLYDADAMRFFRDRLAAEGPSAVGWYGWYALLRASAEEPATLVASGGYFGPPVGGAVEVGYSVVPAYRGRGIATELVAALAARALRAPGVARVVAHTEEANLASRGVLGRAGFVPAGGGAEPATLRFERRAAPSG